MLGPGATDDSSSDGDFPYAVVLALACWALLGCIYLICRLKQRAKQQYVIPRVFVLCSPRTVQFHYELILRVGLPSSDFNPDKHDIDITVLGQQRNEVVPLTRLNTKTLLDEPLITSLSIIAYRLVEMPSLGSLTLRHSGPFKASIYVYDFTVIDLNTNKELYYTINHHIGSLDKTYNLKEPSNSVNVKYPIDDVPLPAWSVDDLFLVAFTSVNSIMLLASFAPINCDTISDVAIVALASFHGACLIIFLAWFLHYNLRWNQERREYFNLTESRCFAFENCVRIGLALVAAGLGVLAVVLNLSISQFADALVWMLVTSNASILVLGFWNVARQLELGETLVGAGLKMRRIQTVLVGQSPSLKSSSALTKSGSASDDEGQNSILSSTTNNSQLVTSIGPRSSVKSFGFEPARKLPAPPLGAATETATSNHAVHHDKQATKTNLKHNEPKVAEKEASKSNSSKRAAKTAHASDTRKSHASDAAKQSTRKEALKEGSSKERSSSKGKDKANKESSQSHNKKDIKN